ncbi:MAG TPA: P1 family peptidase [Syntrophobacteraceae bacterium]|nr:P1 family peptidase [Syntrophobacteraceae bacterium]
MINDTVTSIEGILVGHAEQTGVASGCTVLLPRGGATAGVDIRGGAPGTYGTDTLHPLNLVDRIHALFFTGGSAFGISVAGGVRSFLHERGIGFDSGHGFVPIVAGAVIFDLALNPQGRYPDAETGYRACIRASGEPVAEGNVGAGTGASVGKLYGMERAMKGGLGCACIHAPTGVKVGALMVVNAFGDILDSRTHEIIAGCRDGEHSLGLVDAGKEIRNLVCMRGFPEGQATIVGTVVTNVRFNKTQLTKIAQMAHDGLARTVNPAHTLYDGDTIFALSCGEIEGVEVSVVGALAAEATAQAIERGVRKAGPLGTLPSFADLNR